MKARKAVVLISSGIDSPVAAWMMSQKGIELIGIHCSNAPLAEQASTVIVEKLCKKIGLKKLYIVKHGSLVQQKLVKHSRQSLICVLCKRFMYRVAEAIAKKEGCCCIVTGENLGQVASQTLDNMVVLSDATSLPILRPLLCNDKQETVDLAKKIGTYDIGLDSPPSCTIVPKKPATKAALSNVMQEEQKLDVDGTVSEAVNTAEIIKF
ncbi:7-cyano-7-deazaguanine synthase [Candidatus Woesearchaeota archaeon]|jgi:thiamine biosynthesis protein ThiI|nr:7-cyano-7-deazaguanine synthase [Candidatus Woesearchaeota archaeon]